MPAILQVRVPPQYETTLATLLQLSPEQVRELISAIRDTPPTLSSPDFAVEVARRVSLDAAVAINTVEMLASLYAAWAPSEISLPSFVDLVVEGVRDAGEESTWLNIIDERAKPSPRLHAPPTAGLHSVAEPVGTPHIKAILASIGRSGSMLKWEDNWDGEGSPGYRKATWTRARTFVIRVANALWRESTTLMPVPIFAPGREGNIEIIWEATDRELSLTIPADCNKLADFFGRNEVGEIIEGQLDISADNQWLLMWLMK